jgi:hypothetical protein
VSASEVPDVTHTPTMRFATVTLKPADTVFTTTHGIVACPVVDRLWMSVKAPTTIPAAERGPRTVATISISAVSTAAVPAGLVNETRAVSAVDPFVPKQMSYVDVAVPAAVFDTLKRQRSMVPIRSPVGGTASADPTMYVRVVAAGDCAATDQLITLVLPCAP